MTENEKFDFEKEDLFLQYLRSLGEKSSTTLRCFDRGDYLTLHEEDAVLVAKDYLKSTAALKIFKRGSSESYYVVIRKAVSENFFKHFLLKRQYRVEVYASRTKSGRDNEWNLQYQASPGNLNQFEDILFSNSELIESSGLLAIHVASLNGQLNMSVGFCDQEAHILHVSQFQDSEHLSNLEALLLQLPARECLISADAISPELRLVKTALERAGLLVTEVKKGDFSNVSIEQDVKRLLKGKKGSSQNENRNEYQMKGAMSCLGAIFKFLKLLSDETNFHTFTMSIFCLENFVRLDNGAMTALNLFPTPADNNRFQSIFGLLNYCRTPQGQRLLSQWIKQPLVDKLKIEERLNLVEALITGTTLRQQLCDDFLKRIPDLQRLAKRLQRQKANLQDCYKIYQAVCKLDGLVDVLNDYDEQHAAIVRDVFQKPLKNCLEIFGKYKEMIHSTLDMDMVKQHEYLVKPEFDENLAELREQLDEVEMKIRTEFKKCEDNLGISTLKLEVNSQIGYFMRITKKDEKSLRDFKTFRIIDTQKNGVRFRSATMTDLNELFCRHREIYFEQQKNIVLEIVKIANGYLEPIFNLNTIVALIDTVTSLSVAALSGSGTYSRPEMKEMGSGILELKSLRHPCIEMQENISFIPNDASFQKGSSTFHIITGPNMGGKSTYIRSVGVSLLLAQIGSYVPCDSATVTIVDSIMARVGASDSQSKGISTFQAEMVETSVILNTATPNSLLIIDELGRGTSTYDGFGLAWSISEYIARDLGAFCLFATHFHELTELANVLKTVRNLHVSATTAKDKLILLYQVQPGVCDQSFGIHVARLAHLSQDVIDCAAEKARQYESVQWLTCCSEDEKTQGEPAAKSSKTSGKLGLDSLKSIVKGFRETFENDMDEDAFTQLKQSLKSKILADKHLSSIADNLLKRKIDQVN